VLALAALLAARHSRRALAEEAAVDTAGPDGAPRSARDFEREAAVAERERRYAEAVRLRFRAGLERLAEREVLSVVGSTPNGDLARELHSARFDGLARDFDEIVYGGRAAEAQDAQRARSGWQDLLQALSARRVRGSPAGDAPQPHGEVVGGR
jgi:hypothetical protein